MINYDCGRYGFAVLWRTTGSVLPRVCIVSFPCALLCIALQVFFRDALDRYSPSATALQLSGSFASMLGFSIVFRSNLAYNRYVEGCTLLLEIRGEWFNAYTSTLAFCRSNPGNDVGTKKFQHQFARLVSLLYNCALQQVTSTEGSDFELLDLDGFDVDSMVFLESAYDRVHIAFQWVQKLLAEAAAAGTIQMAPPLLSRVYNQLGMGMTKVNNARKISQFPFPFPYAQLLQVMLILHSISSIALCACLVRTTSMAAMLTFVIVGAFFGVNFIAVEIEAPFGDDDNDLPLMGFSRDMNDSLIELLNDSAQSVPGFRYMPDRHDLCLVANTGTFTRQLRRASPSGIDGSGSPTERPTWSTLKDSSMQHQDGGVNVAVVATASSIEPLISAMSAITGRSKKTRRTLATKDAQAKLDARKRALKARSSSSSLSASDHGQGSILFDFSSIQEAAERPEQSICSISDATELDEGPLAVDIGVPHSWDSTTLPNKNLCLDVDFKGATARMENHVMQIATNVHLIKEAVASAIVALESHLFSKDTSPNHVLEVEKLDSYQQLRQGDCIVSVNDKTSSAAMLEQIASQNELHMRVKKTKLQNRQPPAWDGSSDIDEVAVLLVGDQPPEKWAE